MTQIVQIGIMSGFGCLLCGVPQGSVLGPMSFVCIYFHLVRYLDIIIFTSIYTLMTHNSTFNLNVRILWNLGQN